MKLLAFTIFVCVQLCQGAKLPDYIKKCSVSDPQFSKCIIETANNAIPIFTKGDKKYKLNKMMPLDVSKIDLSTGGLKLELRDAKVFNLEKTVIQDITYNKDTMEFKFRGTIPALVIDSKYLVSGRILILPVQGDGDSKIVLEKGVYNYAMNLKTYQKNGVEHYKVDKSTMTVDLGGATFNFENLFNGDPRLGPEINKFINENWSDVMKEMHPAMALIMSTIVDSVFNGYFSTVPAADIFNP